MVDIPLTTRSVYRTVKISETGLENYLGDLGDGRNQEQIWTDK